MARKEELQLLSELIKARSDTPSAVYLLAGADLVPTVKVRVTATASKPPKDWEQ